MEFRTLGRTGVKVSQIAIGGEYLEGKSFEVCRSIIAHAMDNGINFIDIFNSNPDMRSNVGQILQSYPRESFVIEGHLCTAWKDGQYCRTRDLDEVKFFFEDLMDRLQVSFIDIGMLHFIDSQKDFDSVFNSEIIEYAKLLKSEGRIRSIGMSTHNPDMAFLAAETGLIDVILFSINPAYDMLPPSDDIELLFKDSTYERVYEGIDPKRSRLYQFCSEQGIAITVMKAYAGGRLLSAETSPFEKALTPVQCIHYCLTRPAVAAVMVGFANVSEVDAALQYLTASSEEKDYSAVLSGAPRHSFNGQCMYCGHCAPCTEQIDIALVNQYLDLALMHSSVPDTVKNHYDLLPHTAGECIACGRCMENCPFGVNIIEKMKQAASLFKH